MQEYSIWETGWKENTYILKYYAAVKKNKEDFYKNGNPVTIRKSSTLTCGMP